MKRFKFTLLIVSIALFILPLQAEKISIETAEKVAENYVRSIPDFGSQQKLKLSYTKFKELLVGQQNSQNAKSSKEAMYYVFGINDDQGFIIVSGDDVAKPVLGYSNNGNYNESNPNFMYWMDCLSQEIAYAIENNLPQSAEAKRQ